MSITATRGERADSCEKAAPAEASAQVRATTNVFFMSSP